MLLLITNMLLLCVGKPAVMRIDLCTDVCVGRQCRQGVRPDAIDAASTAAV